MAGIALGSETEKAVLDALTISAFAFGVTSGTATLLATRQAQNGQNPSSGGQVMHRRVTRVCPQGALCGVGYKCLD